MSSECVACEGIPVILTILLIMLILMIPRVLVSSIKLVFQTWADKRRFIALLCRSCTFNKSKPATCNTRDSVIKMVDA